MVFYPFQKWFNFQKNSDVSHLDDESLMKLAFELAAQGLGFTNPNPSVGALIVKAGKIIAWGITQEAGGNHAEVQALNMAGAMSEGSTVYVTLEPCAHHGKTPPCSLALIEAKIAKVVISAVDPNPLVSGKGISQLIQHGVDVHQDCLLSWGNDFYESFFHWLKTGLPLVVVKTAHSYNGAMNQSNANGQVSVKITQADMNTLMHQGRRASQAIIIGANTLRIDQPQLNIRNYLAGQFENNYLPKVLVSTRNQLKMDFKLLDYIKGEAEFVENDNPDSIISYSILKDLGEKGFHQIWVEPGPNSAINLWKALNWDKWIFLRSLSVKIDKNGPWGADSWYPNPHSGIEICKFGKTKEDQFLILGKK